MSIANDARGPAQRECYDRLGCALNNRPGLIFVTPRRGDTTGGIGSLLGVQDTPPHFPCTANQLGAVEIGMGKCSLQQGGESVGGAGVSSVGAIANGGGQQERR